MFFTDSTSVLRIHFDIFSRFSRRFSLFLPQSLSPTLTLSPSFLSLSLFHLFFLSLLFFLYLLFLLFLRTHKITSSKPSLNNTGSTRDLNLFLNRTPRGNLKNTKYSIYIFIYMKYQNIQASTHNNLPLLKSTNVSDRNCQKRLSPHTRWFLSEFLWHLLLSRLSSLSCSRGGVKASVFSTLFFVFFLFSLRFKIEIKKHWFNAKEFIFVS